MSKEQLLGSLASPPSPHIGTDLDHLKELSHLDVLMQLRSELLSEQTKCNCGNCGNDIKVQTLLRMSGCSAMPTQVSLEDMIIFEGLKSPQE